VRDRSSPAYAGPLRNMREKSI